MKTVFYNYIDCLSLPGCMRLGWNGDKVYYFGISACAHLLLKLLGQDKRIKRFDFRMSELKDQNGESLLVKIYSQDMLCLCDKIQRDIFEKDAFIREFGKVFGREKTLIFFRKLAAKELRDLLIFINVISHFRKHAGKSGSGSVEFRFEKYGFYSSLKEFAATRHGLSAMPVTSFRKKMRVALLLIKAAVTLGKTMVGPVFNFQQFRRAKEISSPQIGIPYRYCGINFDPSRRNDFPYLLVSDIPFEQVLVYFESRHGRAPTSDDLSNIKINNGIRYMSISRKIAVSKDIPLYRPSLESTKQALNILCRLSWPILRGLLSGKSIGLCIAKALLFINQYSFSYDYFRTKNIKIVVDRDYSDLYLTADEAALRSAGGVSINYQLSTLPFPHVLYGLCADVVFLFSPRYFDIIKRSGSDNDTIVFTGFLTDSSFAATKEAASKIRSRLISSGAEFIVAYFDESPSGGRMSFITDEYNERVYARLLEWVLRNDKAGVIFSPKHPDALSNHISGISHLVEKAVSTGRCHFMQGQLWTFSWPAEAFQAADLTVGLLVVGTVMFSALLAGRKSVYLDPIGLYSWPEYLAGNGAIVFDSIDNLVAGLDKYLQTGVDDGHALDSKAFLDLVGTKSLFRDGRADERMGQYINWLLDSFNKGKTRDDAIDYANQEYAKAWSEKSVLFIKH